MDKITEEEYNVALDIVKRYKEDKGQEHNIYKLKAGDHIMLAKATTWIKYLTIGHSYIITDINKAGRLGIINDAGNLFRISTQNSHKNWICL